MPFSDIFGQFREDPPIEESDDVGIIKRMRKQIAVYWPRGGVDRQGRPTWGSPVVVRCRWDDVVEKFLDVEGEERNSLAVVYVDRITPTGGYLWRWTGESTADTGDVLAAAPGDPRDSSEAHEIKRFDRIADTRAKSYLKIARL